MADVKLPHKFKIGIGGCPNSCMKPSLNDVGIEGVKSFDFRSELCKDCTKCAVESAWSMEAVSRGDGFVKLDIDKCINCGVCLGKCPFGVFPKAGESLCRIYVGGTWGKNRRMGSPLNTLFKPLEIADVIEKVMLWYKENGYAKERLGAVIDRLGIDTLEREITDNAILMRRDEILSAPIKEQA